MQISRWLLGLPAIGLLAVFSGNARAIEPSNVLVLYNNASPDGLEIATHYAQLHPGVQLLGLNGVTTSETITADYYLSTIRPQILPALNASTDVIVTTKGLPLRIDVGHPTDTQSPDYYPPPTSYVDPYGVTRPVWDWQRYSSLESELTRIDTFTTKNQMGDQTAWIPPGGPGYPHPAANPYYRSLDPFSYEDYGFRLTSRLDGFTSDDVINSLNRSQHANVGPWGDLAGAKHFVIDNDPSKNSSNPLMANLAENVLEPQGLATVYDNTYGFVGTAPGPVIGYVSFGRNQSSTPANYITDEQNGLQFSLANGAVLHTWESFNAITFNGSNPTGQGLIAEWIQRGGSAAIGNIEEPGGAPDTIGNEDQLFDMLLSGHTWAEAAWSSLNELSYVNTVVGDPLMMWQVLIQGDVNGDGRVGAEDLSLLNANWGETGTAGGSMWYAGDLNCDGIVDVNDLDILAANWGALRGDRYSGGLANEGWGYVPGAGGLSVPEPTGMALAACGLLSFAVLRLVTRRRFSR